MSTGSIFTTKFSPHAATSPAHCACGFTVRSSCRATRLGEFLRYHTSLPPRLSELVILATARRQKSEAEWAIHEPLARKAGLPGDLIEALQSDRRPTFTEAAEEAIYDYCEQLHRTHSADESTLQRLLSLVGNKAAIEITGLCGYYTMVAMTLNAFGIGTDAAAPKNQTTKHQAKL
jgi:4-carboxymuconolactone decarboxylase